MTTVTLSPLPEVPARRMLNDLFARGGWPRGKTLARLLIEGLDDAAGVTGNEGARVGRRREALNAMLRRVARDFESHPLRDQFIQLLQEDRDLRDGEIPALVEYLYSSVVNNFKGELAEILARPLLHSYARRFDSSTPLTILSGWDLAEPRLRGRGWRKGADALLVRQEENGRLTIMAVVEIKSYRANPGQMAMQVAKHVLRLRRGLRIGDRELAPDSYTVLDSASLCIRTPLRPELKPVLSDGVVAVGELPFTKAELSKAAFAMAEWFLARLGPVVFHDPGDPQPGAMPNRWPGTPRDEVGRWAVREALFHIAERLVRFRGRGDTRRTRTALSRTYWLYNAMGWGYENARGDRMVWGEDLQPPPAEADAGIERARDHYRETQFDDARQQLAELHKMDLTSEQRRKIAWLEGMVEYRDARFGPALAKFPGATGVAGDVWNHRDTLMEARLAARAGSLDVAATRLDAALAIGIRDLGFDVECEGVRALIEARRGSVAAVEAVSRRARETREEIGRQLAERRASQRDDPQVEWQGLTMGKLDLAAALASVGRIGDAEWWIRAITIREDGWVASSVARDPLLAALQARISDWLTFQRS
jgi:hypothetical protein